ncbi:MAG: 4Fe-4S binding protein [Proteobacteria bacterium]|nr:4Fe-4S binding protein [Pseudomonadota bacterium]
MSELKGWKEIPEGAVIEDAGNSQEYKTGTWRSFRPIWYEERCIQCYRCWTFCPDSSILIKDGKVAGINYDYCKGCGICAHECPKKANAIEMVPERT